MWLDAIGRLHPVVLHFPLALGAAAALMEVLAWIRRRPAPSPSAFTLLWLAALAAPVAAASGWFLAASDGDDSTTLDWHRWTGIASSVGLLGAAIMATALRRSAARDVRAASAGVPSQALSTTVTNAASPDRRLQSRVYRLGVIAVAALIGFCGHLGGEMKWGEGFTTTKLFAALRATLGASGSGEPASIGAAPVRGETASARNGAAVSGDDDGTTDQVLFDPHIRAIFAERCAECHLGGRRKGKLSLTARELIVRSNEDGLMIVKAGTPEESELLRRVLLPEADDLAMPPEGPRVSAVQAALIRRWIESGAP